MNKEELKNQIEQYRDQNTAMLRDKTPKSERFKSVLYARIETLSWVLSLLKNLENNEDHKDSDNEDHGDSEFHRET